MRKNPGNTNTLRKRLIQEVFAKTHASLREIDSARALIDDTERLTGQLNAGGAEAGHRFEARAMLMLPHVVCRIAIDQPVAVPDVLASILRAGLNYAETYPLYGESIAITLVGHDIPVVVTQPILDFLEVA